MQHGFLGVREFRYLGHWLCRVASREQRCCTCSVHADCAPVWSFCVCRGCVGVPCCTHVDNIAKLRQLPTLACILDVLSPQFSVSVCTGEFRGFVCLFAVVCLFVCLFVRFFVCLFVCICIIVLASLCALSSSIIIVSNFNILKTDSFRSRWINKEGS